MIVLTNGYGEYDAYGTYGETETSPYELLMQMKSWNKAIYLRIEEAESGTEAQIAVLEGEIELKVSKTDYNGVTVASLIQQSPEAINIVAQAIDLQGYVTFSSLTATGTTQIDGARITTGYINADRIQANTVLTKLIQAGGIDAYYITSGTISADRIQADTVVTKLIQAGGIDAQYITSGTISADRLSANTIEAVLINAGGISANMITSGTISGDRIYGGTISGVLLSGVNLQTTQNVSVGATLNVGTGVLGSTINLGGNYISSSASGSMTLGASTVFTTEGQVVTSRTNGLSFGFDASTKKLYATINGVDRAVFQGT